MKEPKETRNRETPRSVHAVNEQLSNWMTERTALLVEVGIGVVIQVGLGMLQRLASGNFAVQFARSRSLLLLDEKWERYARLERDVEHGAVLVSQRGSNSSWIRLSDDLGDRAEHIGSELLAEATEADVQTALTQLTAWARARTRILYGSGTKMNDVIFAARLIGPDADDSFVVVGDAVSDPDSGLSGLGRVGGRVSPRLAESVRVHSEEDHVRVVLRCGDGNTCVIFDASNYSESGSIEDQFLRLGSLSKLAN